MTDIPAQVWSAIREMGARAEPDVNKASKQMFAALVEDGEGVEVALDIPYGAHARQALDIYFADTNACAPVVVYVPGGGFTGGDKRQDGAFFANVGRFFARRGYVGVTMNYRLAPEFVWPSAAQDVKSAIGWVRENIARYGGDPERIVLFGHSAGAAHAASYLFDPDIAGHRDVTAAVLSSGVYVLRASEMRPNVAQYFGSDETTFARRSALSHVARAQVAVFLTVAELDPPPLATPTCELGAALTLRDGHPPPFMRVEGHNHFSYICSIGTADERFSGALLAFIAESTRQAPA